MQFSLFIGPYLPTYFSESGFLAMLLIFCPLCFGNSENPPVLEVGNNILEEIIIEQMDRWMDRWKRPQYESSMFFMSSICLALGQSLRSHEGKNQDFHPQ